MTDALHRESRVIDGIGPWLEQRKGHVTASRIGALFDCHPYLSREQLAGELRGESVKGDTAPMRRGRILEAAVIEALREAHPEWSIERAHHYHWIEEYKLGATPDAYLDGDGLIECKTVRPEIWDKWHGRPNIAYVLQLLTGLLCTGRSRGVLACMVLSSDYPVYEFDVARHPAAEQRIIEATAAWWRAWDAGELPGPAPVEELESMLDDGTHIDWSGNEEVRLLLEQRRELKSAITIAQQQLGSAEYNIKNRLGSASTAWLPGWSLTFRRQLRREYTVPKKEIRTLRIKETTVE